MKQITIPYIKSVEENKVIPLPYYSLGPCHAYAITNEHNCTQVCHGINNVSISVNHIGLAFNSPNDKKCSKDEFMEKYNEVLDKLNQNVK